MAYFVEHAQSGVSGAITSIAQNMPAHQANDILIAHITVDSGTITIAGSSWAALPSAPTNPVTQGTISYLYYVLATGSTETLTLTTADAYTCGIYCYRDVDTTTPFDGVTPLHAGVGTATTTPVNSSVTTGTTDALVVFHIAQDSTTQQVLSDPGVMSIYNADSTGTTATTSSHQAAAWYIQRATGATPVANWSSSVSAVYVRITFALRNTSGGQIPAYVDDSTSPGTRLTCGHHVSTINNISYSASGSYVVTATINGKTLTQATAANGADFGINPYSNAVNSSAAATARTALTGPELVLTSGRDLSTGLICGSFIAGTPKMGAFGIGTIDQGGVVVRVASGANNWNAYQVAAKNSVPNPVQRCVFAIQAGYAGSDYDTGSSGSATTTSVTYIQFLRNAPSFSSTVYMSELHQVQTQIVAGGDTNNPVDTDGMSEIGQSFRLPVIQKVGSTGILSFVPIQIGGGDAVNFQIDAGSLQFPRRADTSKKELQYHAADNTIGISYAGKSGDVVKHTNSVVTSPTTYYWEINSAATSAATWDFTGLVIVGANVTLRNVMTFNSMAFSSCPTLNFSSCTITSATISRVPAGNDTLTTNGSTVISGSSINVTGVTAGNRWSSVSSPVIFENNTFTGSSTTGHAIRVTTAGTYSFAGNTFTAFGPVERTFLTSSSGINTSTDVITLDAVHGYTNGDPAYYQDQGGTQNVGLTDGNLYYVRSESSTTITLYDTAAHAISGGATGRANLTAAGAETHHLYSAGAAIYNNTGGSLTLNITSGGSTPSVRESDGSSTTINNAVTLKVTVVDTLGKPIQSAQTAIYKTSDNSELMNQDTETVTAGSFVIGIKYKILTIGSTDYTLIGASSNTVGLVFTATGVGTGTGTATNGTSSTTFNYISNTDIYLRVRKSSSGDTKYFVNDSTGTITSTGFTTTVTLIVDTIASA